MSKRHFKEEEMEVHTEYVQQPTGVLLGSMQLSKSFIKVVCHEAKETENLKSHWNLEQIDESFQPQLETCLSFTAKTFSITVFTQGKRHLMQKMLSQVANYLHNDCCEGSSESEYFNTSQESMVHLITHHSNVDFFKKSNLVVIGKCTAQHFNSELQTDISPEHVRMGATLHVLFRNLPVEYEHFSLTRNSKKPAPSVPAPKCPSPKCPSPQVSQPQVSQPPSVPAPMKSYK